MKTDDVCLVFLLVDTLGTVCIDLTGDFHVKSRTGNKYLMVLYYYDSNGILFRPMKNRSDNEAVHVYTDLYECLTEQNCNQRLNIMDNDAYAAVKRLILQEKSTYQLVEPNNHCVNVAERAIHTFKNYFVAGLSSFHPKFPLYL